MYNINVDRERKLLNELYLILALPYLPSFKIGVEATGDQRGKGRRKNRRPR